MEGGLADKELSVKPIPEDVTVNACNCNFGRWLTDNPMSLIVTDDISIGATLAVSYTHILSSGTLGVGRGYAASSYSGIGTIGSLAPTALNGYTITMMLSRWYNNQNFLGMSINDSQPFSSITVNAVSNGATVTLNKSGSTLYHYTYGSSTNDINMHTAVSAGGQFTITAK